MEHQGLQRHRSGLAYLSRPPGRKKSDLSKFIEEAVRRRVLQCTIQGIRTRNADDGPDEIQRIVDAAVSEVRSERRATHNAGKRA